MKARFIYGYLTSGGRGEKTRISKWCALTRLLNEGPVLELVIALRIMSLIILVSLWPLGFLQRAFLLGRAWKCSFSLWQWTLCAGCALFTLQQLSMGSTWHLASEAWLIHFLPTAISPSLGSCSEGTRAKALCCTQSMTCWHGVDISERLCWLWAGWAVRQGNVLWRFGLVLVTPDAELSFGVGERTLSLWKFLLAELSKTFCPQVLSSYTSDVSLYSIFLQAFYTLPSFFFFLPPSFSFLQKTYFFTP